MATISATIQGCALQYKSHSGYGATNKPAREVWLLTLGFGAYTGASDSGSVAAVVATINAKARDSKTRTFVIGTPAGAGFDTSGQAVYCAGGSGQAVTSLSSDTATVNLADATGSEITSSTATTGVGWLVTVDVNYN